LTLKVINRNGCALYTSIKLRSIKSDDAAPTYKVYKTLLFFWSCCTYLCLKNLMTVRVAQIIWTKMAEWLVYYKLKWMWERAFLVPELVPRSRIFLPWRWRRYVTSKRRFTQEVHSATSKKTAFFFPSLVWNIVFTFSWRDWGNPWSAEFVPESRLEIWPPPKYQTVVLPVQTTTEPYLSAAPSHLLQSHKHTDAHSIGLLFKYSNFVLIISELQLY
jgi:hypothetical protein